MYFKKRNMSFQSVGTDYEPAKKINFNQSKKLPLIKQIEQPTPEINEIKQPVKMVKQLPKFTFPKTDDEWKSFHKRNEEGMTKAYASEDGIYKDGNFLYKSGTRNFQDVFDWRLIPTGYFKNSDIYKKLDKAFNENDDVNVVVGHSAGGSAVLELKRNYPDRDITPITYNAPVFARPNLLHEFGPDEDKPLRFTSAFDPVSMFDYDSRVTYKAPEINLNFIKNATSTYTNPSIQNILNTVSNGLPDPLMGQHKMQGTYSNPSTAKDFLISGASAVVAGNAIGASGVVGALGL